MKTLNVLFVLLFLVILGFSFSKNPKICSKRSDCKMNEICGENPNKHQHDHKKIHGICIPNPYKINNDILKILNSNDFKNLKNSEKIEIIKTEKVLELTKQQLDKIPNEFDNSGIINATCGSENPMEHLEMGELFHSIKISNLNGGGCPIKTECDIPSTRDKYTTKKKINIPLVWNVNAKSQFALEARDRISAVTTELNKNYYYSTGFNFQSTINYYKLPDKYDGYKISRKCTTQKCINFMSLLQYVQGKEWQKKKKYQIMVVDFENERLNGFGMFPWYNTLHGMIGMATRVVAKGISTMPHELGHTFGLLHTFHGVSELNGDCTKCYEKVASDTKGDFCKDTNPEPRNWECGPTLDTKKFPDPCDSSRKQWTNTPYRNLMTYGKCRKLFSQQQIRRMRCYYTKFPYIGK